MRYFVYSMFAALMLGAVVGCGDGGSPPDPPVPNPDDNNPCSGLDNCVRPDDDGNCPNGAQKIGKADGVEYCLTAANPPPCEPDCTGATCGAKDNCGGYCRGTCPEGESCSTSLYCEADDDPCAGCNEPKACVDNVCACPPSPLREGSAVCNGTEGWLTRRTDDCTWSFNRGGSDGPQLWGDRSDAIASQTCSMM